MQEKHPSHSYEQKGCFLFLIHYYIILWLKLIHYDTCECFMIYAPANFYMLSYKSSYCFAEFFHEKSRFMPRSTILFQSLFLS